MMAMERTRYVSQGRQLQRPTGKSRRRACTVAPDAGDAAAWGARLLEHAAVAWGGRDGRVQRLAEVLSALEAHLPAVVALRDALAAGQQR